MSDTSLLKAINNESEKRLKRVENLIYLVSAFLLALMANALLHLDLTTIKNNSTALLFVLLLKLYLSEDTSQIVAAIMVSFLAIFASYFAWTGDGLYDSSILAFPAILILSPLLVNSHMLIVLLLYMLFSIYGIAYATEAGLISPVLQRPELIWQKANNLSLFVLLHGVVLKLILQEKFQSVMQFKNQNRDIKKVKALAEEMALTHSLTKLPNEVACAKDADIILQSCQQSGNSLAVIRIRINYLNDIISAFGQDIGYDFIKECVTRLENIQTKKSTLYHVADREFHFLFESPNLGEINQFAHKIILSTQKPILLDDNRFDLSLSIGIAASPVDGILYKELKKRAITALSTVKAKQSSKSEYSFFDIDMEVAVLLRARMVHDLQYAIDNDQFEVHYQPKVGLATGRVVGVEALIRWRKDDGTLVPPDKFIPIAESSGLITTIGKKVLIQSCKDCSTWRQITGPDVSVSVNLSPRQFNKGNLPNIIKFALKEANLPAKALDLEITESIVINDSTSVVKQIQEITKLGSTIAIDDFGTGYSNLNYISMFNASTLKIDRSFVKDMTYNPLHVHLVNAIFQMTEALDISTVAEGIEDKATSDLLVSMGCDVGQGYYWSKPLPFDDLLIFLLKHKESVS